MYKGQIRGAMLGLAAMLGTACAGYRQDSAGGEVINASDAATTVVLHVKNLGTSPVALNSVQDGKSLFIGSVQPQDTTSLLLDANLFPTAHLFIRAVADGGGERVTVGPIAAGKGDKIDLTLEEGLTGSRALVRR